MRRILSQVALLLIMTVLFACSGGGSSNQGSDTTAPVVTALSMPASAASLTVPVTTFTATDATGVTGYLVTSNASAPSASDSGWASTAPANFTFTAAGAQTAYAWSKDAAGNVSASLSAPVTITLPVAAAVQGVAINPVSHAALSGATVNAYVQPSGAAKSAGAVVALTTTTDANGNFSITGLLVGTNYYFEFVMSGYVVFTYYNIAPTVTPLVLENVMPIPVSWQTQTATISGSVKDASTNAGLANMTVNIRPGVNNHTGSITATTITGSTGAYSFASLAAGSYTAEVTGSIGTTAIITSYFTLYSFPGNTAGNSNQDLPVTTPLSSTGSGQYRIVLNWGNDPRDLDSHLTGPTATSARFHTYFANVSYPAGTATYGPTGYRIAGAATEAFLDVDNISHGENNGPETTTIVVPRTGTYNFYVHHYGGALNISASGAQVKVYKGSALLATFNPPASALGSSAVWSVFTMAVTSNGETITPVNAIAAVSTSSLAKGASSDIEDYLLFSNLPVK